ncbi:MAG: hypothetical protein COU40_03775 [Candidatus Moranbacteria bacterium CG10_big_fil_rev_8_21_14_0_10_35_21]|nr:MAG: hypothetical protein COU40_03775 [Candidatus Moranbacteria bacterium CG10_big_fil_rev_8_21_14_0_10_35_21]PJA88660.1 MAG: hypothetical protein CO139_01925 [Candidatus Moranbacteria bacterium CG_4_9_14_3_um_filter_36_9]
MSVLKKIIPQSIKNIYHLVQAVLANFLYGFPACSSYANSVAGGPSKSIKIIGVTGTNGKTTTVQMIGKILEEAGFKVAVASTINFKIGKKEWINKTKLTTLSSFQIQKFILEAVKARCQYLVLETSSHALDQNRVWGVKYQTAVITNVTRDHFDYHKNLDTYRKAKIKLFKKAKKIVVNLDMENPEAFLDCKAKLKFGFTTISNSQFLISNQTPNSNDQIKKIVAEDIELGINYSKFKVKNTEFNLNIPGKFNVENALAAVAVGFSENVSLEQMAQALEKIKNIPGRLEKVENNKGLNIIIDYAVTPDALEKLYSLILKLKCHPELVSGSVSSPKIIAVFGACGERDCGKRPMMGKIVSQYSDYVIVTNEDPYFENPQKIIDEVFEGIPKCHHELVSGSKKIPDQVRNDSSCFTENINCWKIMDRRKAIKKALQLAELGDFVVVTGKGAEETMAIGKERIEWNDKKVIQEYL